MLSKRVVHNHGEIHIEQKITALCNSNLTSVVVVFDSCVGFSKDAGFPWAVC